MFNIAKYLIRISEGQSKKIAFKKSVSDAIKKIVNLDVDPSQIELKSNSINIKNISQAERAVVYIKKSYLLKEINQSQEIIDIIDIK